MGLELPEIPYFLQAIEEDDPEEEGLEYGGREMRGPIDLLLTGAGVGGRDELKVAQRAEGANASFDVLPGRYSVSGDPASGTGKYTGRLTSKVNFTDVPAPPSTGTKTYLVVLRIRDKQLGGSTNDAYKPVLELLPPQVSGAVAAVPTNAVDLAELDRVHGQTSVLTAHIRNRRQPVGGRPGLAGYFRFWGGNGQAIPRRQRPVFKPFGLRGPAIGCTVPNAQQAIVQDLLPGLWLFSGAVMMNLGGSGDRQFNVNYADPDPAWNFNATGLGPTGELSLGGDANSTVTLGGTPFVVRRGGTVQATLWQDVTASTNVDDAAHKAHFTGIYLGPIPGIW